MVLVLINIRKDLWIPNNVNFKVATPQPDKSTVSKVNQLMLENPKRWNTNLISNILTDQDKNEIHNIPLSKHLLDRIHWVHDSKGIYTVKSGYRKAWEMKCQEESSHNEDKTNT